jgi:chorismate synthase
MVEAMVALTLVDALMMQAAQCQLFPNEAEVDEQPNPLGKTANRVGGPRHGVTVGGGHDGKPLIQRVDEE